MREGKRYRRVQVAAFNLDTYVLLKGQTGRAGGRGGCVWNSVLVNNYDDKA